MSTQETAALIESVNQMTATVAGKMGQIDQKVVAAEKKFDSFVLAADDRYMSRSLASFKVGGSIGEFYPVFVPALHAGVSTITIGRQIHQDVVGRGAMTLRFLAQSFGWGGYPPVSVIDVLKHHIGSGVDPDVATDGFLAKYKNPTTIHGIVFWLRGDTTYSISSSLFNIKGATTFTDRVTDRTTASVPGGEGKVSVYLSGLEYVTSGVTEILDKVAARDMALIPNINYVRGV